MSTGQIVDPHKNDITQHIEYNHCYLPISIKYQSYQDRVISQAKSSLIAAKSDQWLLPFHDLVSQDNDMSDGDD